MTDIFFGVEVTRRCNLRCPHCFTASSGQAHPGPTTAELVGIFQQLAQLGATHVAFSGGEPLLRRDLEAAMEEGRSAGLRRYSLVTNGFLADRPRVEQLQRAGLFSVQVSLDGVDARDHCEVRRCSPVAYYRALRAIRLFREQGVVVDVATIMEPMNLHRAGEMILLCEALGVRSLRYCSFVPTGRASSPEVSRRFAAPPSVVDSFLELLRTVKAQERPPVGVLIDHGIGPWKADGQFACEAGKTVAYITAEGDLYPCPGLIFEPFKVGNVRQTPLAELLEAPALARVRQIRRDQLEEPCRTCDNQHCSGGCRGAAYARTMSEYAAPVYCNVARGRAGRGAG